jgi:hypothetical protein
MFIEVADNVEVGKTIAKKKPASNTPTIRLFASISFILL